MSFFELHICSLNAYTSCIGVMVDIGSLRCLNKHLADLLAHSLVEYQIILLLVQLLVRQLLGINIQIARSYLFAHSASVIFHGRLRSNWFGADHHSTVDSIVLVYSVWSSLLIDKCLRLILLLKYDLVIITKMYLHVRQLLLLFLHHQIFDGAFVDFHSIGCIYAYFSCAGRCESLLGLTIGKLLRRRYLISIVDSLVAFTIVSISVHLWCIGLLLLTLRLLLLCGGLFRKDHTTLAISAVFISLFLLRLAARCVLLLRIRVVDWQIVVQLIIIIIQDLLLKIYLPRILLFRWLI